MDEKSPGPEGPDRQLETRAIDPADAAPESTEDMSSALGYDNASHIRFASDCEQVPADRHVFAVGDVVSDTGWMQRPSGRARVVLIAAALSDQRRQRFREMLFGSAFRGVYVSQPSTVPEPPHGSAWDS